MSSIIQRLQGAFGEPSGFLPNVLIPRLSSRRINPAPSGGVLDPTGRITLNPFISAAERCGILGRCGINRKTKRMTVGVTMATLILSLVVSGGFFTPMAQAADSGFQVPTSTHSPNGWDVRTVANVQTSDDIYAADDDELLSEQGYSNFNFPPLVGGSIVNGIEVQVEARASAASGCQLEARLSWNNRRFSTNIKTAALTGADAVYTLGGAADTWGRTWAVGDFTNANFVLKLAYDDVSGNSCSNGTILSVDQLQAKVYYTEPAPPVANPPLGQSCGLDVALVIDSSGSIDNTELGQMKTAFKGLVDAFLPGTPTQFSVTEFDDTATVTQVFTDDATLTKNAIDSAVSGGFTNWEDGLVRAWSTFDPRPAKPNLILFASDGNPNRKGNGSMASEAKAVAAAVVQANVIKTAGTRIMALGIGDNLDVDNLKAITGSTAAPPATADENADVITANFDTLAATLSDLAKGLCGGKILVQKQFDTNGDGQAAVMGNELNPLLSGYTFDVSGIPSNFEPQTTGNTGSLEFVDVLIGTYSVTETDLPADTVLSSAACMKGQNEVGNVDLQTRTVSNLAMGEGDTIMCTFVNSATTGTLTVIKEVMNGENPEPKQVSDFSLFVNGDPVTSGAVSTLLPGQYTVTEIGRDNYNSAFSGDCDENGAVNLSIGQNLTCTITNTYSSSRPPRPARLTVIKHVINNNGGRAVASQFTMNVTGTNTSESSFVGDERGHVITLDAGSYSVTEIGPNGYRAASDGCSGTVEAGGRYSCTIINDDIPPYLILDKIIVNDNGGSQSESAWTITASGPTPLSGPGTAANDGDVFSDSSFRAGAYSLSESGGPQGYASSDWVCDGGTQDGSSITLGLGESAYCAITNDDIAPKLTVTKIVSGGEAGIGDFKLYVGQSEVTSGRQYEFNAGDYRVSESGGPGDYVPSFSGDCSENGSIALNLGDVKSCTITNTYTSTHGTLKVVKAIVNGGEGDEPSAFTIHVLDEGEDVYNSPQPGSGSGTGYALLAGSYHVEEESPGSEWQVSYSGACDENGNVDVVAGETLTCTVTNTFKASSLGSISGQKFNDVDGDGTKDEGDSGLSGWIIYLDTNDNGVLDSEEPNTLTDSSGNYIFTNLVNGTYNVREVQQPGWTQTKPVDPPKYVAIVQNNDVFVKDFGNHQPSEEENDVCPNIEGIQTEVPQDMILENGQCRTSQGGGGGGGSSGGGSGGGGSSGGGGGGGGFIGNIGPTNVDVTIAEGSLVPSPNITLLLTFGGDVTGIAISNLSDLSGASFEPPVTTHPWTLTSGEGPKTVYVKFRNAAGGTTVDSASTIVQWARLPPTPPTGGAGPAGEIAGVQTGGETGDEAGGQAGGRGARGGVQGRVLGEDENGTGQDEQPSEDAGEQPTEPSQPSIPSSGGPEVAVGGSCYSILSLCWWWWLLIIIIILVLSWWSLSGRSEQE